MVYACVAHIDGFQMTIWPRKVPLKTNLPSQRVYQLVACGTVKEVHDLVIQHSY